MANQTTLIRLLKAVIVDNKIFYPGEAIPVPTAVLFGSRENAIFDLLGTDLVTELAKNHYKIVGDVILDLDDITIFKKDQIRVDFDPTKPVSFSIDPVGVIEFGSGSGLSVEIENKTLVQGQGGILYMILKVEGQSVSDASFSDLPEGLSVVKTNGAQGRYNLVFEPDWDGVNKTFNLTFSSSLGTHSFVVMAQYRKANLEMIYPDISIDRGSSKIVPVHLEVEGKVSDIDDFEIIPDGTFVENVVSDVPTAGVYPLDIKAGSMAGVGFVQVTGKTNPGGLPVDKKIPVTVIHTPVYSVYPIMTSMEENDSATLEWTILRDGNPIDVQAQDEMFETDGEHVLATGTFSSVDKVCYCSTTSGSAGSGFIMAHLLDGTKEFSIKIPVEVNPAPTYEVTPISNKISAGTSGTLTYSLLRDGFPFGEISDLYASPDGSKVTSATATISDSTISLAVEAGVAGTANTILYFYDPIMRTIPLPVIVEAVDSYTITPVTNSLNPNSSKFLSGTVKKNGVTLTTMSFRSISTDGTYVKSANSTTVSSGTVSANATSGPGGSGYIDFNLTDTSNSKNFTVRLPVTVNLFKAEPILDSGEATQATVMSWNLTNNGAPWTPTYKSSTPDGTRVTQVANVTVAAGRLTASVVGMTTDYGQGSFTIILTDASAGDVTLTIPVTIIAPLLRFWPVENPAIEAGAKQNIQFTLQKRNTNGSFSNVTSGITSVGNWAPTGNLSTYDAIEGVSGKVGTYQITNGMLSINNLEQSPKIQINNLSPGIIVAGINDGGGYVTRGFLPVAKQLVLTRVGTGNLPPSQNVDVTFTLKDLAGKILTDAVMKEIRVEAAGYLSITNGYSNNLTVVDSATGTYSVQIHTGHVGGNFNLSLGVFANNKFHFSKPLTLTVDTSPIIAETSDTLPASGSKETTFTLKQLKYNQTLKPVTAMNFGAISVVGATSATTPVETTPGTYTTSILTSGASGEVTLTGTVTVNENPGLATKTYPFTLKVPIEPLS